MKKIVVTLAIALGVCAVNAQEEKKGMDIDFGVKAGMNVSDVVVNTTSVDELEDRAGFYVGGYAEFDLSEKFQLQPELLFSMEGGTVDGASEDNGSLGYLRLPVLAKYNFYKGFDVQVGPQIGVLVTEGDAWEGTDVNSFDFGLVGGLGYEFESGFGIEGRYMRGLLEVVDDSDAYNHNFQLGVTYEF